MIFHRHHIVPRHAGGTDDPSNLVKLSVEDHAEAHRELWEQYGRREDFIAWKGLSGQIGKAEIIKQAQRLRGKVVSEQTRKNLSLACRGKKRNEAARSNMSEAAKGKVWINNGLSLTKINKDAPIPEGWARGKKLKGF